MCSVIFRQTAMTNNFDDNVFTTCYRLIGSADTVVTCCIVLLYYHIVVVKQTKIAGSEEVICEKWMDHNQGAITHLRSSKDTINRHLILRAKKCTCLNAAVASSQTHIIIFNMTIFLLRLSVILFFFLQIVYVLCVLEYLL